MEDPAQRDAAVFREAARDVTKNAYKIMELLVTRSPAERAGAFVRVCARALVSGPGRRRLTRSCPVACTRTRTHARTHPRSDR